MRPGTSPLPCPPRSVQVVHSIEELRAAVSAARGRSESVAVVPTMGALHAGHLSLATTAREEADFVVVTVFVNPSQFGPGEDFEQYPRTLEQDVAACERVGVDLVFAPPAAAMYPAGFRTRVEVEGLSEVLEGACRPGHFTGVATVVLKLLNIVQADVACFGRKDYQQLMLVRRMCTDLNLPTEIRTCPTVREADGLALSSRNAYLNDEQRESALALSRALQLARRQLLQGETSLARVREAMRELLESTPRVQLEYATVTHPETLEEIEAPLAEMVALVAARVDTVRLIDNLPIHLPAALLPEAD